MSLINDVREITTKAVEKIKAKEKAIENHKEDRPYLSDTRYAEILNELQGELERLKYECRRDVQQRLEQYRETVMAADTLDGSKLTDDAKLLNGAFSLAVADLDRMMERAVGNRTMERLIYNYAKEHGMDLKLSRPFYTAEQKAAAAAEFFNTYASNVCARPEYFDIWGGDEYFNEVIPEAIKGE